MRPTAAHRVCAEDEMTVVDNAIYVRGHRTSDPSSLDQTFEEMSVLDKHTPCAGREALLEPTSRMRHRSVFKRSTVVWTKAVFWQMQLIW